MTEERIEIPPEVVVVSSIVTNMLSDLILELDKAPTRTALRLKRYLSYLSYREAKDANF